MTYTSTEELVRVLYFVRKRPGMFIMPLTLSSLGNLIGGYRLCCTLNHIHQDEYDFLEEFRCWLQNAYHMERGNQYSWWNVILQKVPEDGMTAINEFYRMMDMFLEEKQIAVPFG